MADKHIYRVIFHNQGKVYELYAREVSQAAMMGFVEVGDLVFGEKSELLVDPAEERLRSEFDGVRRFYIPVAAVVRIDQVEKRGKARISAVEGGAKVTPFPSP
ncbi:MAG TPA: DUF1820 family protein [Thiotrichales bacterium]|nr:DUF1820 family protein [Thiotrichales bacterium]